MGSPPGAGDWPGGALGGGEEESAPSAAIGARSSRVKRRQGFFMIIGFAVLRGRGRCGLGPRSGAYGSYHGHGGVTNDTRTSSR